MSCSQGAQNLKTYHNNLMRLLNQNSKDMQAMNAAMTNGDFEKAEEVRQTWAQHLKSAIAQTDEMPAFKGDDTFKNVVLEGLKSYRDIVQNAYVDLIKIRKTGDGSSAIKEADLLKKINQTFSKTAQTINQAAVNFRTKHQQRG